MNNKEAIEKLLWVIKDKNDLLVCYRLGKKPTEALFDRLEKSEKTITLARRVLLSQDEPREGV